MDECTVSERSPPPSPDQATGGLKDGETKVLLSPVEFKNTDERSDTKRDTDSAIDREARFTLSDGDRENQAIQKTANATLKLWMQAAVRFKVRVNWVVKFRPV